MRLYFQSIFVAFLYSLPQAQYDFLFLSRQIPAEGSVYYAPARALPGVGSFSRFQVASPGFMLIKRVNGQVDTLLNGASPQSSTLNLIDVSAPSLSYDGLQVVFAGLVNGNYSPAARTFPNAWRLYVMQVDGSGLRQLTGLADVSHSDQAIQQEEVNGMHALTGYDDTDPVWLPDGRIVFSSTRYPQFAMYNGVRSTNLFVVQADGSGLHRITSEKNGADRPIVDPLSGKIVYARWWRNFRWPAQSIGNVPLANQTGGFLMHEGVTSDFDYAVPTDYYDLSNNAFALASINPDGTGLQAWSTFYRELSRNSAYGGSFDEHGDLVGNWFPIEHVTESSGFGGLRRYFRGAVRPSEDVVGVTSYGSLDYVFKDPNGDRHSYGILQDKYAAEPCVLPDGRILFSLAADHRQDYDLYILDENSGKLTLVHAHEGTTELRVIPLLPRALPPVIPERNHHIPHLLAPDEDHLTRDGTFEFDCANIFFNGPVDLAIFNAVPVGKAGSVRFYADPQRDQPGSFEFMDAPILYGEVQVEASGRVLMAAAPADVPLFEQTRTPDHLGYQVAQSITGDVIAPAHVSGHNFGRPGEKVTCVGCHSGHSLLKVPDDPETLYFTNLAPGAKVTASSTFNNAYYLVDRRVKNAQTHWTADEGNTHGQWVTLQFEVPVWARQVVLYNPPPTSGVTARLHQATLKFFADTTFTQLVYETKVSTGIDELGKSISIPITKMQALRIELDSTSGGMYHWQAAGFAEVELIASHYDPLQFMTTTSIKAQQAEAIRHWIQLHIAPNPVPQELLYAPFSREDKVSAINLQGQAVPLWSASGRVQVNHLAPGIYWLMVHRHNQSLVGKFVKL